jgi:hypothetical protein
MSSNITPDAETGLGNWSKEAFINRFHAYDLLLNAPIVLSKGDMQTIMPWTMYAGLTETDLGAIYSYLQSLNPVKKRVVKFNAK